MNIARTDGTTDTEAVPRLSQAFAHVFEDPDSAATVFSCDAEWDKELRVRHAAGAPMLRP